MIAPLGQADRTLRHRALEPQHLARRVKQLRHTPAGVGVAQIRHQRHQLIRLQHLQPDALKLVRIVHGPEDRPRHIPVVEHRLLVREKRNQALRFGFDRSGVFRPHAVDRQAAIGRSGLQPDRVPGRSQVNARRERTLAPGTSGGRSGSQIPPAPDADWRYPPTRPATPVSCPGRPPRCGPDAPRSHPHARWSCGQTPPP